jgi:hypothetical protein
MNLKPKILADYFPVPAHNQSMNKVQRKGSFYSLFPVFTPCFPFYLFYLLGVSPVYTTKSIPSPPGPLLRLFALNIADYFAKL